MSWLFGERTAPLAALFLTLAVVIAALWRGLRSRRQWQRQQAGLDAPDIAAADEPAGRASRPAATASKAGRSVAQDASTVAGGLRDASPVTSRADALADVCTQWTERTGIPIELRAADIGISEDARQKLMWIVHEALANVEAYAQARHVTIDLIDRGETAELHVADNGVGFVVPEHLDQLQRNGQRGLTGMIERAKTAGGSLEIRSTPGGGTRIIATFPAAAPAPIAAPSPARLVALAAAAIVLAVTASWLVWDRPEHDDARFVAPAASAVPVSASATSSPEPRVSTSPPASARATTSATKPAQAAATTTSPTPSPSTASAFPCSVDYVLKDQWKSGFIADLHITNHRSTSLTAWVLRFSFSDGQQITDYWSGISVTQHGRKVSISGTDEHATLDARQTIVVSIQGTWNGQNGAPSAFTLDDAACGN